MVKDAVLQDWVEWSPAGVEWARGVSQIMNAPWFSYRSLKEVDDVE